MVSEERGEGEDAVVGPEGGGRLGLAEGEDPGRGEIGFVPERVKADAGKEGTVRNVSFEIWGKRAQENGAIAGGEGELGVVLKYDGPSGGIGALPEGVIPGVLSDEVFRFVAEIGNGPGFGEAQGTAGAFLFEVGHRFGKEGGKGAGVLKEEGLQRKAALLVEEADVTSGQAGRFG